MPRRRDEIPMRPLPPDAAARGGHEPVTVRTATGDAGARPGPASRAPATRRPARGRSGARPLRPAPRPVPEAGEGVDAPADGGDPAAPLRSEARPSRAVPVRDDGPARPAPAHRAVAKEPSLRPWVVLAVVQLAALADLLYLWGRLAHLF